ncbi:3-ketoacyl-CoA thiolase [Meredithblackwellia eburnea MCA 4105]
MSVIQVNQDATRDNILHAKSDNDVVVVAAVRTPLTKAKKGGLKDTLPEELLLATFKGVLDRSRVNPNDVQEIVVGTVLQPSGGANTARMAQLAAGFPISSYVSTVNRQCSSGLAAISHIAKSIQAGEIDAGIGAGVESMSRDFGPQSIAHEATETRSDVVLANQGAKDCLIPMGITSENVSAKYNITREEQDAFGASSYLKAERAQKGGKFMSEIVPVTTYVIDPKTGEKKLVTVTEDDGIRAGTTKEVLAKLRPAFKEDGTTTAGTSSQVTDGAAAVLLARRSFAVEKGLPILAKYLGAATIGVEPGIMGVGPAYAIPKLLKSKNLTVSDIDFFEINEAFASQALWCQHELGIPDDKLNPNGGALALGHPLGATGARQVATGLAEALKRNEPQLFVTSMCVGSGMGMSALFATE